MVSVVIPALNEEAFLSACLQSVKAQEFPEPFELIVVDNGSTDRTAEVARSMGARVVPCAQRGVTHARQAGLQAAQGDIIVQLDADSALSPGALQRIAAWFRDPHVVAVVGDAEYRPGGAPTWGLRAYYRTVNGLSWRWRRRPALMLAGCTSFRRSALQEAGGYDGRIPHYGDEQGVLPRLARRGQVVWDSGLVVQSSDRRFHGSFVRFMLVDLMFHTALDMMVYRLTGRSPFGERRAVRAPSAGGTAQRSLVGSWRLRVALAVLVALVAVGVYGVFVPQAQVFGKTITRARTNEKVVALTFDDGPNEPYTTQVLDILKRENVQATFFVVGMNVKRHPETVRRILAEGHVLGGHTWDHRPQEALLPGRCGSLAKGDATVAQVAGVRPHLFRPPYGLKTPWWLACARREGMVTVAWDVEANDPHLPRPSTIVERIVKKARPGDIILLHDGFETHNGGDRSRTVEALPQIIEQLRAKGFEFVTVPTLLHIPAYQGAGGSQHAGVP